MNIRYKMWLQRRIERKPPLYKYRIRRPIRWGNVRFWFYYKKHKKMGMGTSVWQKTEQFCNPSWERTHRS